MTTDTFIINKDELDMNLEIGQTGTIMIPVEVISIDKEHYVMRKAGKITPEGEFKPESVKDMRKRIGVVTDLDEPISPVKE